MFTQMYTHLQTHSGTHTLGSFVRIAGGWVHQEASATVRQWFQVYKQALLLQLELFLLVTGTAMGQGLQSTQKGDEQDEYEVQDARQAR